VAEERPLGFATKRRRDIARWCGPNFAPCPLVYSPHMARYLGLLLQLYGWVQPTLVVAEPARTSPSHHAIATAVTGYRPEFARVDYWVRPPRRHSSGRIYSAWIPSPCMRGSEALRFVSTISPAIVCQVPRIRPRKSLRHTAAV
jgi:hypothetical protein